jgi:hypothetical protein
VTVRLVSVAMTGDVDARLRPFLLRPDGQEDVCLATFAVSKGATRTSYLRREILLPLPGERHVHGNASFTGDYVLRSATRAAADGLGVAVVHSHPQGTGWQGLSEPDADAESSYAHLVHTLTGRPLLGLTLAGDGTWSGRSWDETRLVHHAESVRVIDAHLRISWNDALRPPPPQQSTQVRTISGWGAGTQASLARYRVLVVGAGTVGFDIALRLAATGVAQVAVMDYDSIEIVNLDRMPSASPLDVWLGEGKAEHIGRRLRSAATAAVPDLHVYEHSICEPAGQDIALDYDVIFSCVDRPWPRAVLNQLAYSDLIPVIDGGIAVDPFPDGSGMRNATWRSHVIRPGRPCMVCNRQLHPGEVQLDRQDLLDDPEYIRRSGRRAPARQNVAILCINVVGSLLAQFVSLAVAPGGRGDPGPLQYVLSTHHLDTPPVDDSENCAYEATLAYGDARVPLAGPHPRAGSARRRRQQRQRRPHIRLLRAMRLVIDTTRTQTNRVAERAVLRVPLRRQNPIVPVDGDCEADSNPRPVDETFIQR